VATRHQVPIAKVIDGASKTVMFGEKWIDPTVPRGRGNDRSVYSGNRSSSRRMLGQSRRADEPKVFRRLLDGRAAAEFSVNDVPDGLPGHNFGGPHPGFTQFVFVDGHVQAIPVTVDVEVLTALATRAGGESVQVSGF
jgi:prepilin-type processing-associated H-X9-DG protein